MIILVAKIKEYTLCLALGVQMHMDPSDYFHFVIDLKY